MDIFLPSSKASRFSLDVGLSHTPGKQMYGDSDSIKSWINTIDRAQANPSVFTLDSFDGADVFQFATHPFRACHPHSPFSDEFESENDVSFCLPDASACASEMFASSYYDDSDESRSESSLSDDAQYITIPSDSPWYRLPSSSPGPIFAHELTTAAYASSCSSDVRQAIAQQEHLLAVFYEELRRVVPRDGGAEYDPDWLGDVDADLVLAPLETYADLCWESAVCEKSPNSLQLDRPMPDVPIGFDEVHGAC
ncbi:hypothetical protein J3R83DRAFT_2507 [Lanmaoa asiatica]|nr:hypothetical protein J3R83DRAFT_2507 [Lanmaoa asiatica]